MNKMFTGLLLAWLAVASHADTQYITDVVYVPMRSGAGSEFRIIQAALKSGTPMTVLNMPEDSEWAQVRTPSGLDGWVRKQYLSDTPTARLQLNDALQQLNTAKTRVAELERTLAALKAEHASLTQARQSTAANNSELAEELRNLKALSADAINLSQRYKELLARHDLMQTEFDAVQAENDRLQGDQTVNQWLFGAGLVIVGMFLMLILPVLKPRKRSSEWRD